MSLRVVAAWYARLSTRLRCAQWRAPPRAWPSRAATRAIPRSGDGAACSSWWRPSRRRQAQDTVTNSSVHRPACVFPRAPLRPLARATMAPIYCVAGDCATETRKAEALAELPASSLPKAECSLLPQLPADWGLGAAKARARRAAPQPSCGRAPARRSAARVRVECAQRQPPPAEHADVGVDEDWQRRDAAHQKLLAQAAGGRGDGRDGRRARPLRQREAREGNARVVAHERAAAGAGGVEATVVTLGLVGGAPALGQLLDVAADVLFVAVYWPPRRRAHRRQRRVRRRALAAKALWIVGALSEALNSSPCGREAREVRRPPAAAGGGGGPRAGSPRRPRPRRRAARRERRGGGDRPRRGAHELRRAPRVLRGPRRAQGGEGARPSAASSARAASCATSESE